MSGTFLTGSAELKNIFSAPLEAVIDADISLSQKIADFIVKYGFESSSDGNGLNVAPDIGRLKMVSFTYRSATGQKQVFSLPVLALVQMPLLKIKDAEVEMEVRLFSVRQTENMPNLTNEDMGAQQNGAQLKAYLSPTGKGTTDAMSSNLKVKLRMVESDMPGGLIHLLSLMNELNSIKIIDEPKNKEQDERARE